ncbi:selenocysteine insertion sequence-binding protein 2-like isoform X3 [Lingula anatina]|uniref:Selenocysteine insertion sequence-binding protein 2-like isoform X3 n=1 Tax=Lingula anatina TaxID=7574 RepID=A0A1S3JHA2_LINAN|nr:selenocysteine insertion sequence-binding protein 2-like isoform X3 [Lingula anatina]|eukprot:XP_013409777.1 selenocysteine insertion sequence-binding protein 2-like isoform X3 [Lingula anatina]
MSQTDDTRAQEDVQSTLSPEATAFVPKYLGSMEQGAAAKNPPVKELPRYMTNCYPFVKGDPGPKQAGRWQNLQRPNAGQRLPIHHQGGYAFNGPGPPVGYHVTPRQAWPSINSSLPVPFEGHVLPVSMDVVHPNNSGFSAYCANYQPAHSPSPSATWNGTGILYPEIPMTYATGYGPAGHCYPASEAGDSCQSWSGSENSRNTKIIRKKKIETSYGPNMVSIGIQNESGTQSRSNRKPRSKTIILVDAAIQTDFADDIANLTLADKPNALFKKSKMRARRKNERNPVGTTSTDTEVDSDSGYSSPLHRRNQISNGTHPVVISPPPLSYSQQGGSAAAVVVSGNQYLTDACISQNGLDPAYCDSTETMVNGYKSQTQNSGLSTPISGISNARGSLSGTELLEPNNGKKKKRRNRRRKRKDSGLSEPGAMSDGAPSLEYPLSSSNISRTSTDQLNLEGSDGCLHFEDEEEFPELSGPAQRFSHSSGDKVTSYSDILKMQNTSPLLNAETFPASVAASKEGKNARKRRKRREMANRAAEDELAEITIEQQMLKEIGLKKQMQQQAASGKKSKQPMTLNIADMIDALEKQQEKDKNKQQKHPPSVVKPKELNPVTPHNVLDSSAPSVKRGKERETAKNKKPSPLKKVILKEREEKKRNRLLDVGDNVGAACSIGNMGMSVDSDLSQEALSCKGSSFENSLESGTPASAELSPVSQTSPICISPPSPGGSPLSSGVNSPTVGTKALNSKIVSKIHSRRFREYCHQVLDKEIDDCCTQLLQELVRFQDRLYHKDPSKAKSKRRIVLGLREVTKHLKLNKIKSVVISPNLERIQSKGGLDDALHNILDLCQEQDVPFIFALGRRALGRACAKLVPVSVVGVFNFEGAETHFHKLVSLTEKARQVYREMVTVLEKEIQENPMKTSPTVPHLYAHMGHSRTPSACSAISFTSSILSEPISENYPQSEPETDSRGYEVTKHGENGSKLDNEMQGGDSEKITIIESIHEIDEGHEADTEDLESMKPQVHRTPTPVESDKGVELGNADVSVESDDGLQDSVRATDLPYIDSIHSTTTATTDSTTDVVSQQTSNTLNSCDGESCKSFKENKKEIRSPSPTKEASIIDLKSDLIEVDLGNSNKLKAINKDRIETWVADCMQQLSLEGDEDDTIQNNIKSDSEK